MNKKRTFSRFSFFSAFFIVFSILSTTLLLPLLLDWIGLGLYPLRVLAIGLMTAWSFAYSMYFIDTNRGYTRGFWIVFAIISIATSIVAYYWVYDIYYL